jgi:hypothetical protein
MNIFKDLLSYYRIKYYIKKNISSQNLRYREYYPLQEGDQHFIVKSYIVGDFEVERRVNTPLSMWNYIDTYTCYCKNTKVKIKQKYLRKLFNYLLEKFKTQNYAK